MADTREQDAPIRHKRGPKPGTAAAKRGGTAARDKLGLEHYRTIGRKGGESTKATHGPDFYARIGQMGGKHKRGVPQRRRGNPAPAE